MNLPIDKGSVSIVMVLSVLLVGLITGCCSSPDSEEPIILVLGFINDGAGNVTVEIQMNWSRVGDQGNVTTINHTIQLKDSGELNETVSVVRFDYLSGNLSIRVSTPTARLLIEESIGIKPIYLFFRVKQHTIEPTSAP